MRSLLFGHLEDCSTAQYFCFSVRCEVCGEYWYSSSIPFSKAAQAVQHPLFRSLRGVRRILVQQQHPLFQSGAGGPAPGKEGAL